MPFLYPDQWAPGAETWATLILPPPLGTPRYVSPGSNSIRYERSVYYFCMLIGHDPAKDLERSQRFHLCFPLILRLV